MLRAIPRDPARDDFPALRREIPEHLGVLVIDLEITIGAEPANLSSVEGPSSIICHLIPLDPLLIRSLPENQSPLGPIQSLRQGPSLRPAPPGVLTPQDPPGCST